MYDELIELIYRHSR